VTQQYAAGLAPGNFDVWVPNVTQFDPPQAGALTADYQTIQATGKDVWWYDSNNSNFPDRSTKHPLVYVVVWTNVSVSIEGPADSTVGPTSFTANWTTVVDAMTGEFIVGGE
jgi:hypothetical protein